jgi:hypothetical protein
MQGSKQKDWADALRRAVHRESEGKGSPKWLDVIANRVVEAAADGDAQAFKEIGDRLDGKPKQTSDNTHDIKGTLEVVKRIAR